jgi:hypothetical protein
MTNPSNDPAAASAAMRRLAEALLVMSITITGMVGEMAEYGETHPVPEDAEPIPAVLVNLMQSSFDYLIRRHGVKNVKTAAQIVEHAHDLICSEIFIVSDEFLNDVGETEP